MKKREFAAKLLFWLLPWPISKALPRSLRIYYFGPAGGPPPGFYDYWGTPGEFWPDMYTPPDPENFPYLPGGIYNPYEPYLPGPGGPYHYPQVGKGDVFFDQNYWEPLGANVSWESGHWHGTFPYASPNFNLKAVGTWFENYRPSYIHIVWSGNTVDKINFSLHDAAPENDTLCYVNDAEKDFILPITFGHYDIAGIHFESRIFEENPININLIEFLS